MVFRFITAPLRVVPGVWVREVWVGVTRTGFEPMSIFTSWESVRDRKLCCCRVCGRSASLRHHGGMYARCWPQLRGQNIIDPDVGYVDAHDLSSLDDIFKQVVHTKESFPKSLLPIAKEEYGKCLSRVLQYAREDAWEQGLRMMRAGAENLFFGLAAFRAPTGNLAYKLSVRI